MFPPTDFTRAAALAHLAQAIPGLGRRYAEFRNTDRGPDEPTTTALSPFLRRRLVLEQEVAAAALAAHGPDAAASFVSEVFWRSYFKGHLETRPAIWTNYRQLVAEGHARMATSSGLRRVFDGAVAGQTGIACFDHWAETLTGTGWLHNHARMWFASIWIFTLRLPWALGADFFMRHLLDGDPASNTLSWRWVAGLHTRGKAYAARADNIERYTEGRFRPDGLNEDPVPLQEDEPVPALRLPPPDTLPRGEVALLLHGDDLCPESLDLGGAVVRRVAGLQTAPDDRAASVQAADQTALDDALARAAAHFECDAGPAMPGWADGLPVVAAWAPVGLVAAAMPPDCIRVRRQWDDLVWPRSTRGYFQVKTAIPAILRDMGLPGG